MCIERPDMRKPSTPRRRGSRALSTRIGQIMLPQQVCSVAAKSLIRLSSIAAHPWELDASVSEARDVVAQRPGPCSVPPCTAGAPSVLILSRYQDYFHLVPVPDLHPCLAACCWLSFWIIHEAPTNAALIATLAA